MEPIKKYGSVYGEKHREGRWVAPDKFAGQNLPLFQNGIFSDPFSSILKPGCLMFGVKTTKKRSQRFSMKFYGPLTPKFTEYFDCFTKW